MEREKPLVFVSYATRSGESQRFIRYLRANERFEVFVDRNTVLGNAWRREIAESISTCDIAILLLSKEGLVSPYVQFEVAVLLYRRLLEGDEFPVIPIWLGVRQEDQPDEHWTRKWDLGQLQAEVGAWESPARLVEHLNSRARRLKLASLMDVPSPANPGVDIVNEVLRTFYLDSTKAERAGLYSWKCGDLTQTVPEFTREEWLDVTLPLDSKVVANFRTPGLVVTPHQERIAGAIRSAFSLISPQHMTDGPKYRLLNARRVGRRVHLDFGAATYYQGRLEGTGVLEDEVADVTRRLSASDLVVEPAGVARHLGWRRLLLPDAAALLDLRERICLGGISALLALRRGDGFYFLYDVRKSGAGDRPGKKQTLPRGFHQPRADHLWSEDVGIWSALVDSMHRKLYVQIPVHNGKDHPSAEANQTLADVDQVLRENTRTFLTGLTWSLLNGNYALHILIVANDRFEAAWRERFGSLVKEGLQLGRLDDADLLTTLQKNEEDWSSDSVVTILQGIRTLQRVEPGLGYPPVEVGLHGR